MKTAAIFVILLAVALAPTASKAESPPTQTPPRPPFKAAEAALLADKYVANTFPRFPDLYCSELHYEYHPMKPDETVIWRLRYLIPNNPRNDIEGSPHPDWGICLVLVHADKSVSHTVSPRRNDPAEPGGARQPATRPESKPE